MGLLDRIKNHFKDDFIYIEEWTMHMSQPAEKSFVGQLVSRLEDSFPGVRVVSVKKAYDIEERTCGMPLFKGYRLKLTPNVDLKKLKRTCMAFEQNLAGARISDLDVYYNGQKVSRKDPDFNY